MSGNSTCGAKIVAESVSIDLEPEDVSLLPDSVRVNLNVHSPASDDELKEVSIYGSREGLIWLARQILRIAHAKGDTHTHIDAEAFEPVYSSSDGWWLTVGVDSRLIRRKA